MVVESKSDKFPKGLLFGAGRTVVCALFCILLCASDAPAAATTYYLSPSGDDDNAGTSPASPWRTTARANAVTLAAGDSVLFLAGGVFANSSGLALRNISGTPGAPITVGTYAGGSGGGGMATLLLQNDAVGILLHNAGGVIVSSLAVRGVGLAGGVSAECISVYSDGGAQYEIRDITIAGVDVAGCTQGIAVSAASCSARIKNVTIRDSVAHGNVHTGVVTYGPFQACLPLSDILVTNVTAYNNTGDSGDTSGHSGSGIILSGTDGGAIEWSVAYDNGHLNAHYGGGPVGIWTYSANNVRIAHCVSYHNSNGHPGESHYLDGGGFDLDGGTTNSVIEYCLSFENSGPGFLVCQFSGHVRGMANNTVRHSVSYHDGLFSGNNAGGLQWYSPDTTLTGTTVYGMTVFTNVSVATAIQFSSTPQSGELITRNAIITEGGTALLNVPEGGASGLNITGNAWWDTGDHFTWVYEGDTTRSLSAFRAATGQERDWQGHPAGTDTDPKLQRGTGFFAACVPAESAMVRYPDIPNSPALDSVRGFSGC